MRVNDVYYILQNSVTRIYRFYCVKKNARHYFNLFKMHGIKKRKLTRTQKKEVDRVWKEIGLYDYSTHILTYSVTGKFNPYVCPEMLFRTSLEMNLNNQPFKDAWSDKGYFGMHLPKELQIKTIACNINGVFYDEYYNVISEEEVLNKLQSYNQFVIKPTIDSGVGKGIKLVENTENIASILKKYGKNYILQERFIQHNTFKSFNQSSVNIVRFISLFIDGEVIPVMSAVRCGAEGSFNDNDITKDGMGMFVIGMDENGKLKDKAVHSCGKTITCCPNGTEFKDVQIPGFEEMKNIIKICHSKLAYFGFIGWDFVVDETGTPKIMEYNIKSPGILYYQYVNGPLFGKYTDKVIAWAKRQKK